MTRFLLQYSEIRNKNIVFSPEQSKKIRKVLRLNIGDKVGAFDNKGWEYIVELEKVRNLETIGKIIEQTLHEKKSNITLYQALPKNLKVEFLIQKCTELGIDNIIFWESEFSQIKSDQINNIKIARWRKIAGDASEQCGRIFIPEITLWTKGTPELISRLKDENPQLQNFIVLEKSGEYLNSEKLKNLDLKNLSFFIGPEGGFSPTENKIFESENFRKVKIAENILRSETAGMTILAQMNLFNI